MEGSETEFSRLVWLSPTLGIKVKVRRSILKNFCVLDRQSTGQMVGKFWNCGDCCPRGVVENVYITIPFLFFVLLTLSCGVGLSMFFFLFSSPCTLFLCFGVSNVWRYLLFHDIPSRIFFFFYFLYFFLFLWGGRTRGEGCDLMAHDAVVPCSPSVLPLPIKVEPSGFDLFWFRITYLAEPINIPIFLFPIVSAAGFSATLLDGIFLLSRIG